jgi:glyoxylase-like metal-dependent hydrolase (beta-lactamase superfamily II)
MKVHRCHARIAAVLFLSLFSFVTPARAACYCPVDVNADGVVNIDDLVLVITNWSTANPAADVTDNGIVDIDDLVQVITAWSQTCPIPGVFPAVWNRGASNCGVNPPPPIQVHQFNADTYILRQSKCSNFEGPFMYLLFGQDKVLLQDTGAGGIAIRTAVMGVINQWLAAHNQASIQLIVSHTHGHGDHVAGDSQFINQPNTTVVGTSQAAVAAFFGINTWPTQIVPYDLGGGRVLDVIPIPGHQSAHIALYDRKTGILLTGDTLYPGHLFISSWTDYRNSVQRLVNFIADKPVCHVLGTHIEMTSTPTVAYPYGTVNQPNEHVLQLTRDTLLELNTACQAMGNSPVLQVHNDFIIEP